MKIAVIPARGGSKRIPRKNIKDFCGKPMIAWSIEAAMTSGLFDHIIVSTDDTEIADIAREWGAEVPFIRPLELSDDYAGTTEVVAHATRWSIDQGWPVSAVCCIYATAPFVQIDDLRRGLQLLESGNWAYAFTATDFAAPIFRAFKQLTEGGVEMFFPEQFATRSQDLPVALHDAGQFYWGRPDAWANNMKIFEKSSVPVVISRLKTQDIDTPEDWAIAELMFKILTK
ncbi:MAG: pseudaminic acid cytidylyltransferase [Methylotenera sp.]|nr:pseudaminic acid cytidylyltransferase [Methylotenera sp.]